MAEFSAGRVSFNKAKFFAGPPVVTRNGEPFFGWPEDEGPSV
jgi:hypothetical protein